MMRSLLWAAWSLSCAALRLDAVSKGLRFFGQRRPLRIVNAPGAPTYDGSSALRVLVWNVQYCAGIRQHYFYDGGRAVSSTKAEVLATTAAIGDVIAEVNPDVVLLQEVDRGARRTGRIDEYAMLATRLGECGLGSSCSASYWRVPYVPSPNHEHLGRTSMHLATFSRFKIEKATRHQLPLLAESRLRRIFNLRRAVLETHLANGPTMLNTHLSAFSRGDGTLERQVTRIQEILPRAGPNWLIAGDFNSLTPFERRETLALEEERALYSDSTAVKPLYDAHVAAWAESDFQADAPPPFTYKAWTSEAVDRTIDHAFASPGATFESARVVATKGGYLSDHQPLEVLVSFPKPP